MDNEKKNRKLMRVYINPETEPEIAEWAENQQNVSISVKALIRMAIAVQGIRDVLTLPFGVNALTVPSEADTRTREKFGKEKKIPENDSLSDIRKAYYDSSQENKSDTDDMDVFGTL